MQDEERQAHRSGALRIIVVAVDGKDWDPDVEILVFVVDSREASCQLYSTFWAAVLAGRDSRKAWCGAVHWITQQLELHCQFISHIEIGPED
jgi:hypothetical protein